MKRWNRLEKAALAAYAIWMTVGLAATVRRREPGPWGDFILIVLAALNLFLYSRSWRWLFLVVAVSAGVEGIGTGTGFPFGPYAYTGAFGPRWGPLPLAIPLAWYVLLGAGAGIFRKGRRLPRALCIAALVTGIDWLMEPFAVRIKGYWLWKTVQGLPPAYNYAAWAALAFLLALAAPRKEKADPRPALILGSMAALFVLARVAYRI